MHVKVHASSIDVHGDSDNVAWDRTSCLMSCTSSVRTRSVSLT